MLTKLTGQTGRKLSWSDAGSKPLTDVAPTFYYSDR